MMIMVDTVVMDVLSERRRVWLAETLTSSEMLVFFGRSAWFSRIRSYTMIVLLIE